MNMFSIVFIRRTLPWPSVLRVWDMFLSEGIIMNWYNSLINIMFSNSDNLFILCRSLCALQGRDGPSQRHSIKDHH